MKNFQETKRERNSWRHMKRRCYDSRYYLFHFYGGRGIIVCERWLNSFDNFLEDMGPKTTPSHSLDRIDNNGNYEKSNCKWSTHKEQNDNRSNSKYYTYNGKTQTIKDWADDYGVTYMQIYLRIHRHNLTIEQALTWHYKKKKWQPIN